MITRRPRSTHSPCSGGMDSREPGVPCSRSSGRPSGSPQMHQPSCRPSGSVVRWSMVLSVVSPPLFVGRHTEWANCARMDASALQPLLRIPDVTHARLVGMTTEHERFEVARQIAAPPDKIFAVLCDPHGHVTIDSSGMLQSADGAPVSKVGDEFVVHMDRESLNDYPLGKSDVTVTITQ